MGVQGLLQLLKPAQRDCNLSQFRNQTAAVDVMTWLYKGAYSCAYELGLEQQTLSFLSYPIKMIKLVQAQGIKPICVFDGLHLKAKEATERMRSQNKKANKELAMQRAEDGREDEARKYFTRSLVLRSKMIDLFIDILRCLDIEFIIAPYEADAQIAYMVKEGIADFAISEDSDLIAYGCPKLVMKLNFNGYCKVFSWEDFKENKNLPATDKNLPVLQSMTREQFVQVCIMGGCEYLPSIQQVGLKVAVKQFAKYKTIEKVMEAMTTNKTFKDRIPENYLEALKKVQQLFFYQTVYDPRKKALTSLEPIPEGEVEPPIDQEFLGADIDADVLDQFVNGYLCKSTLKPREIYGYILDFKRLLSDYKQNSVTERSFVCLDRTFFKSGFSQSARHEGAQGAADVRASEEEKKETLVWPPPEKIQVDVDDLGFCMDDDDDDEIEEVPLAKMNLDNKFLKEDLEQLSSLCSDIIKMRSEENTYQGLNERSFDKADHHFGFMQSVAANQQSSVVSTPKSNKNRFIKQQGEELPNLQSRQKEDNPFKKFDQIQAIPEDPEFNKKRTGNIFLSASKNDSRITGQAKDLNKKEVSSKSPARKSNAGQADKKRKLNEISGKEKKLDQFFEKKNSKRLRLSESGQADASTMTTASKKKK